jgi:5-methylcytosine-specific restriction endonuclease McrA
MSQGVLVIDQTYRPVDFVTTREAAEKLVMQEAFAVPGATVIATYRSANLTVEIPSIISLKIYVPIPKKLSRFVTNTLLFARDDYTCQYCGTHKNNLPEVSVNNRVKGKSHRGGKNMKMTHGPKTRPMKLTRDHVKPQSAFKNRSDANTWENVVTACEKCNNDKADRLPYECGMYPIKTPKRPNGVIVTVYDKLTGEQRSFVDRYYNK